METTELIGTVRRVDITTCTLLVEDDQGTEHSLEWSMDMDAVYYYGWLNRYAKCIMEDGIVTGMAEIEETK